MRTLKSLLYVMREKALQLSFFYFFSSVFLNRQTKALFYLTFFVALEKCDR